MTSCSPVSVSSIARESHWILFGAPILVALAGIALGITLQLTAHELLVRRCRAGRRRADPGAPADAALPQLRLRRDRQRVLARRGLVRRDSTGDAAEQDRGDRRGAEPVGRILGYGNAHDHRHRRHTRVDGVHTPAPRSSGARCRARSSPSTSAVAGSRRPPATPPDAPRRARHAPCVRSESWRGLACASTAGVPSSRSELPRLPYAARNASSVRASGPYPASDRRPPRPALGDALGVRVEAEPAKTAPRMSGTGS